MDRLAPIIAAALLLFAAAVHADGGGNALRAMQRMSPDPTAQIAPAWRDALSRMTAQQLDELRHGAGPDSIVLDGGESLAAFMASRRLVDLPVAIMVEPVGGGTSRGGSFLIDGAVLPTGSVVPNGSLTGGTLRLDPLLTGGGGISTSTAFQLTASVGQPTVARSNSTQSTLQSGFWTPGDAVAVDRLFRDGFE